MDTAENILGLATALHSAGPDPERAEKLGLYAFLVGDWETEIVTHAADGASHRGEGEIHAGWILEGRAIQDVWTIPRRRDRRPGMASLPLAGNWYGTTLRIYDPALDAWRILWIDPATNSYRSQIGRAEGVDIVQIGEGAPGTLSRWSFTRIARDRFHWLGEASGDQGATWRLGVEVLARRVGSESA